MVQLAKSVSLFTATQPISLSPSSSFTIKCENVKVSSVLHLVGIYGKERTLVNIVKTKNTISLGKITGTNDFDCDSDSSERRVFRVSLGITFKCSFSHSLGVSCVTVKYDWQIDTDSFLFETGEGYARERE